MITMLQRSHYVRFGEQRKAGVEMAEEIVIEIGPTGDVIVSGKGIAGADCTKLTAEIEKALGEVMTRKFTQEYHQQRGVSRKVGA